MAISHQAVFAQTPKITPASLVNADGTGKKTLHTAGANGSKVVAVCATSTDTVARIAQLWLTRSATSYLLGSVNIPIASGSDGSAAAVNLLLSTMIPGLPIDNDGQRYLHLESGDTFQVSVTVAVTAAKEVDFLCIGADF